MRVVLMTTVRGQQPAALDAALLELGLHAEEAAGVSLVGWHAPRRPLPVGEHLVLGPSLSLGSGVQRALVGPVHEPGTMMSAAGSTAAGAELLEEASGPADPAAAPMTGEPENLEEDAATAEPVGGARTTEPGGDVVPPAGEPAGAPTARAPLPPLYSPRRVAMALRWRVRRARRVLRRHPLLLRVRSSTRLRRLRQQALPGTLADQYAVACLRAAPVREAVARADVVVAMDANTYKAAWLLARRHPGPTVVAGLAAGKRAVEEARERAAASPQG